MKLLIKTVNPVLQHLYTKREHNNPGDSGLDLFCPDTITVKPCETVKIDLKIKCEAYHSNDSEMPVSYYLYPRSSIIKTPLRLANSVGIIDSGYRGNIIACGTPETIAKAKKSHTGRFLKPLL